MSGTPKMLVVDVETSPMLAYVFGLRNQFIAINQIKEHTRVISYAAGWADEERVSFKSEYHHGQIPMLQAIRNQLDEADIVIHFNGDTFDDPHLRREFKMHGIPQPSPYKTIDLYKAAKKTMYFPSNKLDYIAQQLGVGSKLHHEGFDLWIHCLEDSPADDPNRQRRAWNTMRRYNKQDIVVERDLYWEIRDIIPNHPNLSLYLPDDELNDDVERCPYCTSMNLRREGRAYLQAGVYPRFQCRDCSRWSRGKKALAISPLRGI